MIARMQLCDPFSSEVCKTFRCQTFCDILSRQFWKLKPLNLDYLLCSLFTEWTETKIQHGVWQIAWFTLQIQHTRCTNWHGVRFQEKQRLGIEPFSIRVPTFKFSWIWKMITNKSVLACKKNPTTSSFVSWVCKTLQKRHMSV